MQRLHVDFINEKPRKELSNLDVNHFNAVLISVAQLVARLEIAEPRTTETNAKRKERGKGERKEEGGKKKKEKKEKRDELKIGSKQAFR